MKKVFFLSLFITLCSCVSQQKNSYSNIDLTILHQKVIGKDVQFIDVRTPEEYIKGHIDDAKNIDFYKPIEFKASIQKLNKKQPVYLYCKSGVRSKKASKLFNKLGFKTVYNYSGGWNEWVNQ